MKDSALPANPLDVGQVEFDNAEHRRAFYDGLMTVPVALGLVFEQV